MDDDARHNLIAEGHLDMNGLTYTLDGRSTEPNIDYRRRGQFKQGWNDAAERGQVYDAKTLETLYWQNLGWRFGVLLGPTSEALQEAFYEICVQQQAERMNS
jgi:hypothetical protein